ncbi:MAG: hypothetical protein LBL00_07045 [Endomicrobium sp.]|jgi:hypothetical protein|nr:hypothetical protein [Endomicrobium sp.]
MKKFFVPLLLIFFCSFAFSQENSDFNGKTVKEINIKTSRISQKIARKKFLMQEGEVFFEDNYDTARQALHDMRVFKSIDFNITENEDDTISVNIDAKDGYYVFPMIFGSGGSKSTFAAALMEANLFKAGEMLFLFGVFSSDGFSTMAGFGLKNNFFAIGYGGMQFEESVYKNGSYSTSGMFTAEPDKDKFGDPINKYDVKNNAFSLSWSRSFYEKLSLSAGFTASDIKYKGNITPSDEGKHNKAVLAVRTFKNVKHDGGGGFGALFGIGLSDIADKLADLPKEKYGYSAGLTYETGGDYTGSDYDISKINLKLSGNIEFKTRNVILLDINAAKDFESRFNDKIKSRDVLSGKGIYSREFRGTQAIGTGLSFVWHPVKNKTGILSVVPFIENAILWNGGSPQNHGGAGAIVSYQIWRIPFPIGINFTQNLNDGSSEVSFTVGGGF